MPNKLTTLFHPDQLVKIDYINWVGERGIYTIYPWVMWWGSTQYHPEPQLLIQAWVPEKNDHRTFAVKDILHWEALS